MFGWFALFFFFFGIGAALGLLYVAIRAIPFIFRGFKALFLLPRDVKRAFEEADREFWLRNLPSAARRGTPGSPSPSTRGSSSR